MLPCLKAKEISKEIKGKLPVIDEETFKEHFCSICPYYAGRIEKVPHCMQARCAWDDDEERFSPVLMEMMPIFAEELQKTEEKYLNAKHKFDVIQLMFEQEVKEERRRKDPCYECAYGTHAPCIGFCYKQMTANPVEPSQQELRS